MGVPFTSATSINGLSWLGVEVISNLPSRLISQTQPLPKRPIPAPLNFVLNSSKEPNVLLIASPKLPDGEPPSFDKISQKKVWFQCPPPLLRTAGEIFPALAMSSSRDLFSCSEPAMALFRLST